MLIEQTEIAKKLGISNNSFRRIAETADLSFELIANKRHYRWEDVLFAIRKGNNNTKSD